MHLLEIIRKKRKHSIGFHNIFADPEKVTTSVKPIKSVWNNKERRKPPEP